MVARINYWIRNLFGFDQKQTRGFRTVTLLMLLVLALPFLFSLFLPEPVSGNAADTTKLDSLMALLDTKTAVIAGNKPPSSVTKEKVLFDFDPNQIDASQWQALGLPKYVAERIIKYRDKGGKFKVKKDVLKIYGFPPALYEQLYTHILLPDTLVFERKYNKSEEKPAVTEERKFVPFPKKEEKVLSFNLNTADTAQFIQVKGIGPALSKRIIKYRDLLGGFVNTAQIGEVYGLDSTVVEELLKYGYLEENLPLRKLNVNTATVQELDAHPYITPKIAQVIVAYRQQHGKYTSPESLYNIRVLDKASLQKLLPYLSFD